MTPRERPECESLLLWLVSLPLLLSACASASVGSRTISICARRSRSSLLRTPTGPFSNELSARHGQWCVLISQSSLCLLDDWRKWVQRWQGMRKVGKKGK
eukprot:scaffold38723_cov14-Tisochrysis_lutea.AAC.1